jgi:hypothetical protein
MRPFALVVLSSSVFAQNSTPIVAVRDARLLPQNSAPFDHFGASIALDGTTAAVGAPGLPQPNQDAGAVYLFERTAAGWIETVKLTANDSEPGDRFGSAVAMQGDSLIVGAPGDDDAASEGGSVYVFERVGGAWTQVQKLLGIGADTLEAVGWSLALDGDTFVAGAADDHHGGGQFDGGAAYVFTRTATGWAQQQRVIAGDGEAFDYFSRALDLQGDTLVVGSYSDNHGNSSNGGSVYVFRRSGTTWANTQKIVPADNSSNDNFGFALELVADELVVGAPSDTVGAAFSAGSVYVFEETPTGFGQVQKLVAPAPTEFGTFGFDVALQGDVLIVGADGGASAQATYAGAVHVYQREGVTFELGFDLRATIIEQGSDFGSEVALDGEIALIGAPGDDAPVFGQNAGAVFAYVIEPEVEVYCTAKVNGLGCTPAIGWTGSPSVSSTSPFVISAGQVLNQKTGLLLYGYAPNSAPFQGGTLCVASPIRRTSAQNSGGSANTDDCTGTYAFDFNAWLQAGADPELSVGSQVFAQYWSRDPFRAITIGLTDALHFHVRP